MGLLSAGTNVLTHRDSCCRESTVSINSRQLHTSSGFVSRWYERLTNFYDRNRDAPSIQLPPWHCGAHGTFHESSTTDSHRRYKRYFLLSSSEEWMTQTVMNGNTSRRSHRRENTDSCIMFFLWWWLHFFSTETTVWTLNCAGELEHFENFTDRTAAASGH